MSGRDDVAELTCDEVREMAGAFVLGALEPADEAAVRAHLADLRRRARGDRRAGRRAAGAGRERAARRAAGRAQGTDHGRRGGRPRGAAAPSRPRRRPPTAPTARPLPSRPRSRARRSGPRGAQRTSPATWILRIAAVVAIVALVGWNLLLQNQLNASQAYEQSVAAVLDVAAQPGSLTAILTPDDGTGSGLAAVSADGAVTLAMQDLAPTTGSTVYTAWAIGGDGVPVAARGLHGRQRRERQPSSASTSPLASGTAPRPDP